MLSPVQEIPARFFYFLTLDTLMRLIAMKKIFHASMVAVLAFFLHACSKETPVDPPAPNPPGENPTLSYPKKEMRAAWIATVWGLDWPDGQYTLAAQKKQYTDYLD